MSKKASLAKLNPLFFQGICHRGLWNDQLTENGLKAFENAISHGFAFEYDIHLTKDGQLLVCHDSELKRTTGKAGIIENLTLAEIKTNYTLLDGEKLPSFQELLDLNHEQMPMVCELKVYQKNYRALAKAAKVALRQLRDKKNVWIISFDPRALLAMGHRYQRALLVCKEHQWTWKLRYLFEGVDLEDCLVNLPSTIRYRKHHLVNTWTIQSDEQYHAVLPYVDTVTFQRIDPTMVRKGLAG
jgi:glycerophosphoryl diester phosphodiesterase